MPPPLGQLYDVGGRRLMLHRAGAGSPAVVIEAGAGNFGFDYIHVQDAVSEFAACVVYDRAGYGWSEPDAEPRTAARATDDMQAVLRAAGLAGPYVLVGHSLGGLYVRRYAQRFADDVVGLVLVEPSHEDLAARMPVQWRDLEARQRAAAERMLRERSFSPGQIAAARSQTERVYASWPDSLRDELVDRHLDPDKLLAAIAETSDLDAVGDEVRRAGPLPDVPTIVLTGAAVEPLPISAELARQLTARKLELHAQLAASITSGEHRVLEDSGHMVQYQRPDAITQAVRDVLIRVRNG